MAAIATVREAGIKSCFYHQSSSYISHLPANLPPAYGLLAAGLVDLVVEADLKPYDYMALVPVIKV
jgi:hypothetical protein